MFYLQSTGYTVLFTKNRLHCSVKESRLHCSIYKEHRLHCSVYKEHRLHCVLFTENRLHDVPFIKNEFEERLFSGPGLRFELIALGIFPRVLRPIPQCFQKLPWQHWVLCWFAAHPQLCISTSVHDTFLMVILAWEIGWCNFYKCHVQH